MKTEYLKKRDRLLSNVAKGIVAIYIYTTIILTFVIAPFFEMDRAIGAFFVGYVAMLWWMTMCERHKYCREASLMILSAVFFFIGCLLQAPLWILVRGFYGAWELFICRLKRFIKLETYRFKKHS